MNTNNCVINKDENESELLFNAVFEQIQECGDIISSILIIYKFIEENEILTTFNRDELRQIALRSVHNETSTYLWHINALIAASSNFEHLLLGIEMMFDRFLGNKSLFIKEKQKQKLKKENEIKSKPEIINNEYHENNKNNKNNKNEFVGNEIVSFVNSYYKPSIIDNNDIINNNQEIKRDEIDDYDQEQNDENNRNENEEGDQEENERTNTIYINDENININKINKKLYENQDDDEEEEEQINKEYMKSYRGKISSPISFRMKQQKRMMQSERRQTSKNVSIDLDFNDIDNSFDDGNNNKNDENEKRNILSLEPEILSPFNVSKFAKTVDLMSNEKIYK